jgi:4-alpha-glucanotransferase
VRESLTELGIPGYRVQRWEKNWKEGGDAFLDSPTWPPLSVATTGTHDTESLADWFEALSGEERTQLLALPQLEALRERAGVLPAPVVVRAPSPGESPPEPPRALAGPLPFDAQVRDALLALIYSAGSALALLPFQDLLGARERVNLPGTVSDDNWTYRIPMDMVALAADQATRERLGVLAARSGRASGG